jgi:pyruvate ferredoxin oxidoreductase gamma subunit/2-oxoisovalerate ferredoxin oxidoreductase gamma subunit
VVNTAILGAFARATGVIDLDHLLKAIDEEVPATASANRAAAQEAYETVRLDD